MDIKSKAVRTITKTETIDLTQNEIEEIIIAHVKREMRALKDYTVVCRLDKEIQDNGDSLFSCSLLATLVVDRK